MLSVNLTLPSTSTSFVVGSLDGDTRKAFRAAVRTQVVLGLSPPLVVLATEMNYATSTVLMIDPEINSFPSNVVQVKLLFFSYVKKKSCYCIKCFDL